LGSALSAIARWIRRADSFRAEEPAGRLFGVAWQGWLSDFANARALGARLRAFESGLLRENLRVVHLLAGTRQTELAVWADRLKLELPAGDGGISLFVLEEEARRRAEELRSALQSAQTSGASPATPLDSAGGADIAAAQAGTIALEGLAKIRPWFKSDEDPADLRALCEWITRLRRALVPRPVLAALSAVESPIESMLTLGHLHEQGKILVAEVEAEWTSFTTEGGLDPATFFGAGPAVSSTPISVMSAAIAAALDDEAGLRLHADLGRSLREARRLEVAEVYEAALKSDTPLAHLADAYELALVRTLLQRFLHASGADLSILGGGKLELVRERFRTLDRELQRAEAKRILLERQADAIPAGNGSGPVSTYTQRKLLEYVVQHHRARVTLRALAERAGVAMQAVKPVWMMSPTTAAQYAPPGKLRFDLIVIDEASQMTPEMAIGALGRGAQIVVVGDPKQLPPSRMFAVAGDNFDDEEEEEAGPASAAVSILDLAYERLGARRRLKWHYRSRHEQLIMFSNREFYESELVTVPAAASLSDFLGVRTIPVDQGLYQGGVNEAEARVVLEEAVGLMVSRPDLSLGVVTMNAPQRELLFEMLEDLRSTTPAIEAYMSEWEKSVEPFFIKNLENVQGDERDVIIVSTVYGPEMSGGPVLQRFGLINRKDEGHKRLNVLVTRAKRANWIVTSLRPNDVKVTPDSSRGIQAFQRYLVYARGGATTDLAQPPAEPDSDFEIFVAERLRAHGYVVTPQVGVAGFRIDLGISHPDCPDGFLAGVECDSARYHSHYTVRDRDRIRQDVLEGLGWRIWRVWSTDWFNDPDRETGRLVHWLQSLRDEAIAQETLRRDRAAEKVETAQSEESTPELFAARDAAESESTARRETLERSDPSLTARPKSPGRPVEGLELHGGDGGYFEVAREGELIGDIERTRGSTGPARLFDGGVRSPLPEYRATHEATGSVHITSDIYEAVRWLKRKAGDVTDRQPA